MAEILALGISHYPPLSGQDDRMAGILKRMLRNPKLPEHLRTPEGWRIGLVRVEDVALPGNLGVADRRDADRRRTELVHEQLERRQGEEFDQRIGQRDPLVEELDTFEPAALLDE